MDVWVNGKFLGLSIRTLTLNEPPTKSKSLSHKRHLPNPPTTGSHMDEHGDPTYAPSDGSQSTSGQLSEDQNDDLPGNDPV